MPVGNDDLLDFKPEPVVYVAAHRQDQITETELQGWLLEHLLEKPGDVAEVLDLLKGDVLDRFWEFLDGLGPETELFLHRRMVKASPELLAAIARVRSGVK